MKRQEQGEGACWPGQSENEELVGGVWGVVERLKTRGGGWSAVYPEVVDGLFGCSARMLQGEAGCRRRCKMCWCSRHRGKQ